MLVVFSILIAPSLIALKLFNKNHILYATTVGSLLILISIILSYNFDLPTGYTIVFINTLSALTTILIKK